MARSTSAQTRPDEAAVLTKAVLSAGRRLGLSNRSLARVLGSSEASVSRLGRGRLLRGREAETGALLVRVFRSLDALVGGDEGKARRWFEADNQHLGSAPVERVGSLEGLVDVLHYLDGMRGKL